MPKYIFRKIVDKKLDIKPNGIYVDGTLGRGGHSKQLLKHIENGHLYA